MPNYLQICAAIVALTEAALPANVMASGFSGDLGASGLQTLAFGAESASVLYYFQHLGLAELTVEETSWRIGKAKEETGLGDPLPTATSGLLLLASVTGLVEAVLLLNGFGTPERGKNFHHGSAEFAEDITDLLGAAEAKSWDGDGAEKYNERNTDHKTHVQWMAEADRAVDTALRRQADDVEAVRLEIAGIITGLAYATPVAIWMFRNCLTERDLAFGAFASGDPVLGKQCWNSAWAWARSLTIFVTTAVTAAVGGVIYLLYHLINEVAPHTKHHLHQARDRYQQIVAAAETAVCTTARPAVRAPVAAVSPGGGFTGIAEDWPQARGQSAAALAVNRGADPPHPYPVLGHAAPNSRRQGALSGHTAKSAVRKTPHWAAVPAQAIPTESVYAEVLHLGSAAVARERANAATGGAVTG